MSSLVKIRAERDQMSAIERRIADFILENAHLLRDYSSQQLANSLGISQSSVVKFSQKLGFKGYPDLKVSVSEAVARENGNGEARAIAPSRSDPQAALAADLWRSKALAEEETRLINTPEKIAEIARAIDAAGKVFVIGLGEDGLPARAFAVKLTLLGVPVNLPRRSGVDEFGAGDRGEERRAGPVFGAWPAAGAARRSSASSTSGAARSFR